MHTRRTLCAIAAATLVAGAGVIAQNGNPTNANSKNVLTLAVYGDSPYGTSPTDTVQTDKTPAFIESINKDPKVDLVLQVGDIHSGSQFCTESYDRTIADLWAGFKNPLVYTPGDNEWADCHKKKQGGHLGVDYADGDPLANLDLVRSIFYANPGYALGGRHKQVLTQAQQYDLGHPEDGEYVENVMWEQSQVLFVTLNVPGDPTTTPTLGSATALPQRPPLKRRPERRRKHDARLLISAGSMRRSSRRSTTGRRASCLYCKPTCGIQKRDRRTSQTTNLSSTVSRRTRLRSVDRCCCSMVTRTSIARTTP